MFLKLPARIWHASHLYAQGTLICTAIALAASFLFAHFGGPLLLYALLFGLSFHFFSKHTSVKPGVDFCGRSVLRIGVALLGARITVGQVVNLGPAVCRSGRVPGYEVFGALPLRLSHGQRQQHAQKFAGAM